VHAEKGWIYFFHLWFSVRLWMRWESRATAEFENYLTPFAREVQESVEFPHCTVVLERSRV